MLWEATDRLRFGATYRQAMDLELDGRAEITPIPTGNAQLDAVIRAGLPPNQAISTTLPFPAVASVGVAFSPNENWDVEFDITHMTWSEFEALTVNQR